MLVTVAVSVPAPAATAASSRHPDPTSSPTPRTSTLSRADDRAADDSDEPLDVDLISLSPGVVPTKGAVELVGTVRNASSQTWRDINVHAWDSTTPITSTEDLATAAATDADADVGERLTSEHGFVAVGDLAPGQQTSFTLRVPRAELTIPDEPGVYFMGVHALGTSDEGREVAGRARTFMPVVDGKKPRAAVALVLPFRQAVSRDADEAGQLRDPDRWRTQLSADGRLERLLGLAESAGNAPLTMLLDPAVLDAVATLAQSDSDSKDTSEQDDVARAKAWLVRFRGVASHQSVLGLGYGDPDVAALARHRPALLSVAASLSEQALARHDIDATPAAAPVEGALPPRFSDLLDPSTVLLMSDTAVTGSGSLSHSRSGQPLVTTSTATAQGGPSPTPATWALAMRQRILAEASLHRTGTQDPLVVELPAGWNPGPDWSTSGFFAGLRVPWLRLVRLGADTVPADAPTVTSVAYPSTLADLQLSAAQIDAVSDVRRDAEIYADALVDPGSVVDQFTKVALEGASFHARAHRETSLRSTRSLATSVRDRLAGIHVEGFSLVTMSGGTGRFTVTLVNDLSRPVKVGLRARTSGDLHITTPTAAVLPAGQRTTVRLRVTAGASRVRTVVLTPETSNGHAVGTPFRFSIRNSRVSSLVWGIMAGAFALLAFTIARRAVRRGLRREPAP
ncbi:hypothetical protein D9V37_18655 [Nocardioides mangrovicus]|uniref:Uncharacterized protein n=1 Tax=Nocardioides mangrovicus TaxID=2478913 RepID=A0A3L8NZL5_9ACTN|nr:hypothetical protein D9V37_18655 [Nocardioides mangrovicus]